jgi:hypothetical protein
MRLRYPKRPTASHIFSLICRIMMRLSETDPVNHISYSIYYKVKYSIYSIKAIEEHRFNSIAILGMKYNAYSEKGIIRKLGLSLMGWLERLRVVTRRPLNPHFQYHPYMHIFHIQLQFFQ